MDYFIYLSPEHLADAEENRSAAGDGRENILLKEGCFDKIREAQQSGLTVTFYGHATTESFTFGNTPLTPEKFKNLLVNFNFPFELVDEIRSLGCEAGLTKNKPSFQNRFAEQVYSLAADHPHVKDIKFKAITNFVTSDFLHHTIVRHGLESGTLKLFGVPEGRLENYTQLEKRHDNAMKEINKYYNAITEKLSSILDTHLNSFPSDISDLQKFKDQFETGALQAIKNLAEEMPPLEPKIDPETYPALAMIQDDAKEELEDINILADMNNDDEDDENDEHNPCKMIQDAKSITDAYTALKNLTPLVITLKESAEKARLDLIAAGEAAWNQSTSSPSHSNLYKSWRSIAAAFDSPEFTITSKTVNMLKLFDHKQHVVWSMLQRQIQEMERTPSQAAALEKLRELDASMGQQPLLSIVNGAIKAGILSEDQVKVLEKMLPNLEKQQQERDRSISQVITDANKATQQISDFWKISKTMGDPDLQENYIQEIKKLLDAFRNIHISIQKMPNDPNVAQHRETLKSILDSNLALTRFLVKQSNDVKECNPSDKDKIRSLINEFSAKHLDLATQFQKKMSQLPFQSEPSTKSTPLPPLQSYTLSPALTLSLYIAAETKDIDSLKQNGAALTNTHTPEKLSAAFKTLGIKIDPKEVSMVNEANGGVFALACSQEAITQVLKISISQIAHERQELLEKCHKNGGNQAFKCNEQGEFRYLQERGGKIEDTSIKSCRFLPAPFVDQAMKLEGKGKEIDGLLQACKAALKTETEQLRSSSSAPIAKQIQDLEDRAKALTRLENDLKSPREIAAPKEQRQTLDPKDESGLRMR